jgi:RHS repeat-associated protein
VVQHLEYIPFGEVFIDERAATSTWSTPYKFNAKELDEETGLYYYGARYYDPRTSVWISVDPLAEITPNLSSYVYCKNNPVNFIDPDGRFSSELISNISRFFHGGNKNGPSYNTGHGDWGYNRLDSKDENPTMNFHDGNNHNGTSSNQNNSSHRWGDTQPYGETTVVNGGSGWGVSTKAKINGPFIDASLFNIVPFGDNATIWKISDDCIKPFLENIIGPLLDKEHPTLDDDNQTKPIETIQINIETVGDEKYEWNNKVYHDYPHRGWKDSIIKVSDTLKVALKYKKIRTDSYIKIKR